MNELFCFKEMSRVIVHLPLMHNIGLLSDMGNESPLPAIAHSIIRQLIPDSAILDINHSVAPFDLAQTKYFLHAVLPHSPTPSYFFILTDLFKQNNKRLLYARKDQHHIFCADNGFMTLFFDQEPFELFSIKHNINKFVLPEVLKTLCDQVLNLEQNETSEFEAIDVDSIYTLNALQLPQSKDSITVSVVHIDRFENIIFDIQFKQFEELRRGRKFRIEYFKSQNDGSISETYADIREHDILSLFNTAGYLELAMNRGKAAGTLGFQTRGNGFNQFDKVIINFFE